MKTKNTPKQWAILTALATIGFFAFLLLAGEDTPDNPMSLSQFFTIKLMGMAILAGCLAAGKWCGSKGLLPQINETDETSTEK